MEKQGFDILEEKINHLLSILNRLKTENHELKNTLQVLEKQLKEKDIRIQTLSIDSQNIDGMKSEIENYRENQNRIKSKVETLLEKLKEFEDIP